MGERRCFLYSLIVSLGLSGSAGAIGAIIFAGCNGVG